jgi:hypothetical protein
MYSEGEKGYPLVFFQKTPSWFASALTTIIVIVVSAAIYTWYSRTSNDPAPDSTLGFTYAIIGTLLLVMAAVLFTLSRRSRKRGVGQLNASLNWHMSFGIMGIALLFMHSFGNFNPRTGTYALYGMIALVISGLVGKLLDHLLPRQIAIEVQKALTAQGEDRLERISQQLQAIVVHNTQQLRAVPMPSPLATGNPAMPPGQAMGGAMPTAPKAKVLPTSWDLAYISLEATPQEVSREAQQYRFVPDKQSALTRPGALIPGAQAHISALKEVQRALQREQFYRYVIRYWRIFHISLALLTIGLTIWHIIYALELLIPVLMHS